MKTAFTVLLLVVSIAGLAQSKEVSIKILSTSDGIFHFKVSGKLPNAFVEVLDDSNRLISKQPLDCKRMMIDFYDATPGTYHIHITAPNFERNYNYVVAEEKGYMKVTTALVQLEDISFERYCGLKSK